MLKLRYPAPVPPSRQALQGGHCGNRHLLTLGALSHTYAQRGRKGSHRAPGDEGEVTGYIDVNVHEETGGHPDAKHRRRRLPGTLCSAPVTLGGS